MKRALPLFGLLALAVVLVAGFIVGSQSPMVQPDGLGFIGLGGMIIAQHSLSNLFTAFKASFSNGFAGAAPSWNKIATLVPSTTAQENYAWLGQFPMLREWIGDRQVKNLSEFGYSLTNKDFESTVGVPKNAILDDQFGIYSPLMQEMGRAAAMHPDSLVYALLAAGFTTNCFDGQYYFDSDHPVAGASVSNTGGGSGAPWVLMDTSRALKPLIFQRRQDYEFQAMTKADDEAVFTRKEYRYGVDARANVGFGFWQMAYGSKATLDATNFNAAREAMMAFKGDNGTPLGIVPDLLVCGPSNMAEAEALLEANTLASGATNTNYKKVQLLISPYLT